jgi:phytanoyl-CoA hydroxylase
MNPDEYRERGFLLARGFFEAAEIDRIRNEAKEIFQMQMIRLGVTPAGPLTEAEFNRGMVALFEDHLQVFVNCGKQVQHLISLHRLSLDERIISVLRTLGLSFPNVSTRPILYFNSPSLAKKEVYWRLSAHQDWRSMQGSLDSMIVWIPLVDIDRKLGALEVIPGSHRQGLRPSEMTDGYGHMMQPVDAGEFVPVEVRTGDALFFSSLLVHQSGTNSSDLLRWSCHFRYNNLREPTFVSRGFPHPYIYKPQEELITPDFPQLDDVRKVFP